MAKKRVNHTNNKRHIIDLKTKKSIITKKPIMTKQQSIMVWKILNKLKNVKNTKFAYLAAKNLQILNPEIEIFRKLEDNTELLKDYEKNRLILAKKMCKRDGKDQPIIIDGVYQFEDFDTFTKAVDKLKNKYKKIFEEIEKKNKEYIDFLNKKSDLVLIPIELALLPDDLNTSDIEGLRSIIKD